jgi:hypothetical protein
VEVEEVEVVLAEWVELVRLDRRDSFTMAATVVFQETALHSVLVDSRCAQITLRAA